MHFTLIGWNYKKTPIEVRERLTLTQDQQIELAGRLKENFKLGGILILSTCNRTEFFFANAEQQLDPIIEMLQRYWNIPDLLESIYILQNLEASRHLFKVASSLDSMVLGEPQILGQLKETFHFFSDVELIGKFLHPLFTKAFSTAKRVRTETTIASNAVSVSYAAVELARHIFEDLSKQSVIVIGAGEMAELAVQHLMRNGISQLFLTNRTFASAAELAEKYQGLAVPFEHLNRHLHQADIVISSTGARNYIITKELVKKCLLSRKGNPMFFIDIAVPRDIDPEINNLHGTFCYDIDDLQSIVLQNQEERKKQSIKAEEIIEDELSKLEIWFRSLSAVPTIRSLRKTFQSTAEVELEKVFKRINKLPDCERKEIEQFVHRLVNKLLHEPTRNLKMLAQEEDFHLHIESITKLFDLSSSPLENTVQQKPRLKIIKS
ncbi:MAG: glutamyl-tRNA reductase [Deltaproteobacteria bacterium]|nr:glutamyl-tRNA reductase [Deltaproteobacteria bacterium]|tara:strand:- start:4107 stop:5414 length:1308 start_codon:yes stop_codon:yes gene_type:complete